MDNRSPTTDMSAVPPPPSLTNSGGGPVNFNDALSKARAIAEKLKKQNPGGAAPPAAAPSAGVKRGHRDDGYDDEYQPQSSYRSGDYYDDQRDTKRGMYDRYEATSSRPRYGLGSEERKSMSSGGGGYGGYGAAAAAGGGSNEAYIQEECSVPNHMVGLLIGKGGDNLKKIERMSGAKVQIAPDMGELERKVHMTGEEDQVKIARDMIQQIVDDTRNNESTRYGGARGGAAPGDAMSAGAGGAMGGSYGPPASRNNGNDTTMMVPGSKVGLIIGRGGETIRDLEERSGAKITIIPENNGGERSGERCISISGESPAVQRAKALIDEIVSDAPAHATTSVAPSRDWTAYRQQHYQPHGGDRGGRGGPGGDDDSYGAYGGGGRGGGPRGGDEGRSSYGPPQDRGYGRGRFNNYYNNEEEEGEKESVQVPQNAVGFIIGKRGDTVRALQDQSGARIKVDPNGDPNAPERTISIFGNPDAVALAKQLIEDKVAEGNANRDRNAGGGGRFGHDGGRRGGYRGYGNDRYGGHHHNNNRYHQQHHQQQYQDDRGNGGDSSASGYDYSQYQQYYAQYGGYDQYQQQVAAAAAQQGTGEQGTDLTQGNYQYNGYPYNYGGQPGAPATLTDDAPSSNKAEGNGDETKTTTDERESKDPATAAEEQGGSKDQADYYAQYYGQGTTTAGGDGAGDDQQQQQGQWTQEAYYQWYQQYYGQQYAAAAASQQQNQDGQQQQPENEQQHEQSTDNDA
ncbi:hypothetical protein BDB00DRAFT_843709 [Zychaea mexicana]|uniref:uncharacterized protein n=1 Tax=Zychaea mexicana TaxID=64656 RepID=UPI0022FEFB3E|nr:uncharacterized protein BDB00DRAFT_843709 [Zychaea mexicana]KAI9489282.1 hypothetical protein BDB00DRAFT_843709 [Zychaea mexicana]